MDISEDSGQSHDQSIQLTVRLSVGLGQGFLLYLLSNLVGPGAWFDVDPLVFAPLHVVLILVPVALIEGLATIRARTLIPYLVVAAIVIALIAIHEARRTPAAAYVQNPALFAPFALAGQRFLTATTAAGVCLFIAQALVAVGDAARRPIGRYADYYDVAWKYAVQMTLTILFVGLLWGILWLGAELFQLIKLSFLETLIKHR